MDSGCRYYYPIFAVDVTDPLSFHQSAVSGCELYLPVNLGSCWGRAFHRGTHRIAPDQFISGTFQGGGSIPVEMPGSQRLWSFSGAVVTVLQEWQRALPVCLFPSTSPVSSLGPMDSLKGCTLRHGWLSPDQVSCSRASLCEFFPARGTLCGHTL